MLFPRSKYYFLFIFLFPAFTFCTPSFSIDKKFANQGDQVDIQIKVSNFDSAQSFQFSLSWDAAEIQFLQINNLTLPNFRLDDNFNLLLTSQGQLGCIWDWVAPITLPSGSSIFTISYRLQTSRGSTIKFQNTPVEIDYSRFNGSNITPILNDGNLFAVGYNSTAENGENPRIVINSNIVGDNLQFSVEDNTLEVALYDVVGNIVQEYDSNFGVLNKNIPVGHLPAGIYILVFRKKNQIFFKQKILKF
jgi:hypothetical protein